MQRDREDPEEEMMLPRILGIAIVVMLLFGVASACPADGHPPHLVKFTIAYLDTMIPLPSGIVAVPNESLTFIPERTSVPSDWIVRIFGISQADVQVDANMTTITTGPDGTACAFLYGFVKYNMTLRNQSYTIYPYDDDYKLFVNR
jgi:hypothetical protein